MKTLDILKSWPVDAVTVPPARRALEAGLVTAGNLLRLKVIARLQARGLPPEIGWSDLLQEAFTRVLDGSRRHPDGLPMVTFVAGIMRSLREQYWRTARRGARQARKLLAEIEISDTPEAELLDPEPSPERRAIAQQEMAALVQLFADDESACQLIVGLYEGLAPEEVCAAHGMSKVDYDSTRRRIRRALVRAGLRFGQS